MSTNMETQDLALVDCWNRIGVWAASGPSCETLQQVTHCRNCERYTAAGRRILDRPMPEGYQEEWSQVYGRQQERQAPHTHSAVIFRLGDDWLSLPSHLVREITTLKPIHSLPHRGRGLLRGLVNIRGELRICISLGNLLGLHQGELTSRDLGYDVFARMMLIDRDGEQFVFPVTEVQGTHRFSSQELHAVPTTIGKAKATYTRHILKWKERNVACLDEELLLYTLKKDLS
jgi:chemotaxis-related protein WspD